MEPNTANRCYPVVNGKHRPWVVVFLVALVVIGWGVLMPSKRAGITAHVIGQTNINGQANCLVIVSNGANRIYTCVAWTEWSADGTRWARDIQQKTEAGGLPYESFSLQAGRVYQSTLLLPTREGKHRVSVRCFPPMESGLFNWRYWQANALVWFGKNPAKPEKLYVDVLK